MSSSSHIFISHIRIKVDLIPSYTEFYIFCLFHCREEFLDMLIHSIQSCHDNRESFYSKRAHDRGSNGGYYFIGFSELWSDDIRGSESFRHKQGIIVIWVRYMLVVLYLKLITVASVIN
jgi:hypothetical protein